jgi:hypothetical protein
MQGETVKFISVIVPLYLKISRVHIHELCDKAFGIVLILIYLYFFAYLALRFIHMCG